MNTQALTCCRKGHFLCFNSHQSLWCLICNKFQNLNSVLRQWYSITLLRPHPTLLTRLNCIDNRLVFIKHHILYTFFIQIQVMVLKSEKVLPFFRRIIMTFSSKCNWYPHLRKLLLSIFEVIMTHRQQRCTLFDIIRGAPVLNRTRVTFQKRGTSYTDIDFDDTPAYNRI